MLTKKQKHFRKAYVSGGQKTQARIEQKTAEMKCMRVIDAFRQAASWVTFVAATAALDAYEKEYVRWIAPIATKLNGKGLHDV